MIKLTGDKISSSKFDRHSYICDLINFEGPFLSLYKDEHSDWLYLWSDTDGKNTDRWLIFQITRGNLLAYLKKHLSLRELLIDATPIKAYYISPNHPGLRWSIGRVLAR